MGGAANHWKAKPGAATSLPSQRDELRWDVHGNLFQDWSIQTYTLRPVARTARGDIEAAPTTPTRKSRRFARRVLSIGSLVMGVSFLFSDHDTIAHKSGERRRIQTLSE
jgi:hypothetical protein